MSIKENSAYFGDAAAMRAGGWRRDPRTSIFIVSYAQDADWIPYLLKSIGKFCTGFEEIVLAVPEKDSETFEGMGLTRERLAYFPEEIDGFMEHQFIKCSADLFCHGDFIVHVDSDCVFNRPTTPEVFFRDGKPLNLVTNYETLKGGSPWQACTCKVLARRIEVETMRRHGNIYPRTMYAAFRDHVWKVHKKTLREYLRGKTRHSPKADNFSEFCALGAFGYYFRNGEFYWLHTEIEKEPENHVTQMWSFNRANHPDVQAKCKELGLI